MTDDAPQVIDLMAALKSTLNQESEMSRAAAGFMAHKVIPSPDLAVVIGPEPRMRTQVTKDVWAYIKRHGLQDKANRRLINADEKLLAVFGGRSQVSMFELTRLVSRQLSKHAD